MMLRIAYLLILSLAVSCSVRPLQLTDFRELDIHKGWERSVELALDMEDTSEIQMLEICMQVRNSQAINNVKSIPVIIGIVSPQGIRYTDSIALPTNVRRENSYLTVTNGIRNYKWPYRRGIENKLPGRWSFTITPLPGRDSGILIYKEIIGVGISCKKDNL